MATPLHIAEDPHVEGVVRVSRDPSLPGPRVGVLGAMHGNEPCGLDVIGRLRALAETGELPLARGTLVLVHGNPEASAEGRRFTDGGEDINRVLDFGFEAHIPAAAWTPEHRRALALRTVLEELDVMVDLHSARADTVPFAIANDVDGSRELARRCGMSFVAEAWKDLADKGTIGVLARLGRPAIIFECGRHEGEATAQTAFDITHRFLVAVGIYNGDHPPEADAVSLEVIEILKKPSERFRFARDIRGLSTIEPDELVGTDGTVEIRVEQRCWALLPDDQVPVGEDVLYLARAILE